MESYLIVVSVVSAAAVVAMVVYLLGAARRSRSAALDSDGVVDAVSGRLAADHGAMSARLDELDRKLAAVKSTVDKKEGMIEEKIGRIGVQMTEISSMFTNDRRRGTWGEISLARIFEQAGLVEGRDYENQFSDGDRRPDVVVRLPGDRRIVIDSKFPVARYQDAMAAEDASRRKALFVEHGRELERVGRELAKKHYGSSVTGGYVLVYLPSQAVYEAAVEAHSELIDRLLAGGVIVAGPVNVFALLKTVGSLLAEHRAVSDAREIVEQVRDLRERCRVFSDHLSKVGSGLRSAVTAFNGAVGSWNSRLNPAIDRISDMSGVEGLDTIEEVDETVRGSGPPLREVV